MKRFLLPAGALVLVVTVCGAGVEPAPRVTETAAQVSSVRTIAARREHAATREARKLLREFVLPPGAHSAREPRSYGGVLRRPGPVPVGEVVAAHRFWSVRKPLATVAAFVRTHRPHGFGGSGATPGPSVPHYLTWSFTWPPDSHRPTRYLNVTAVALPGRTVIRVDAQVLWIYPRSPSERVPAATREIVVRAPKDSAKVTDPAKVAQVVDWFDALPVSPPGIVLSCPLEVAARITLSFRDAGGAWLAQATVPSTPAWVCNTIGFRIGGQTQKPLVDSDIRESFVRRLQGLLGVQLIGTYR